MRRYKKKKTGGGINDLNSNRVVNIGSPPMSEFINTPQYNPQTPISRGEQLKFNQDSILNSQSQIIKQLQLNNQLVESQNKLLENQNKLTSMTNSVRKLNTSDTGSKNSVKRKGGKHRDKTVIFSGNGYMRKGGKK